MSVEGDLSYAIKTKSRLPDDLTLPKLFLRQCKKYGDRPRRHEGKGISDLAFRSPGRTITSTT